jgi:hypothetical protein
MSVMKTLRILILVVAIATCSNLKAQQIILRMDTSNLARQLNFDSIIHLGDTMDIAVPLTNIGQTTFSDSLAFDYYIGNDSTIYTYNNLNDTSGIFYPFDTLFLPGNDTTVHNIKTLHVIFNNPEYTVGPSVVVIWPVALHAPFPFITDTFYTMINILGPATGIQEPGYSNLKVFMYQHELIVTDVGGGKPDRLKVYNDLGEAILEKQFTGSTMVPMGRYASGIYFAEITFADNGRRVFKVFNPGTR